MVKKKVKKKAKKTQYEVLLDLKRNAEKIKAKLTKPGKVDLDWQKERAKERAKAREQAVKYTRVTLHLEIDNKTGMITEIFQVDPTTLGMTQLSRFSEVTTDRSDQLAHVKTKKWYVQYPEGEDNFTQGQLYKTIDVVQSGHFEF
jgi:hypothetical protein